MLRRLRSILGLDTQTAKPFKSSPLEVLKKSYHDLSRLAEQIDDHADKAPYPYVTRQLNMIAAEKRAIARLLKNEILRLGGQPEESKFEVKSGKNHWERMTSDLEDQRALENQFLAHALFLMEEAPKISDLLQEVVAKQAPHRESLLNLLARADPQANLT